MMCTTCGCSATNQVVYTNMQAGEGKAAPGHLHFHAGTRRNPVPAAQRSLTQVGEMHYRVPGNDGPAHRHGDGPMHSHATAPGGAAPGDDALHARVHGTTVALEQEILGKNQLLAERNRAWFAGRGVPYLAEGGGFVEIGKVMFGETELGGIHDAPLLDELGPVGGEKDQNEFLVPG